MTTNHTPGPWQIWKERTTGERIILGGDSCAVADVHPGPARDVDARLIAKAPELLIAAQRAFALLCKLRDEYGSVAHTPVHEELGRVIAEATGDALALKAIAKMDHRLQPGTPDPRD